MQLDTTFLERCIDALENAHTQLPQEQTDDFMYDIVRAACVKEFEIVVGISDKLLRRRMYGYFNERRQADNLTPRDLLRHAAKFGLIDIDTSERWLNYHINRSDTIYDYNDETADHTLGTLPQFITDARALTAIIGTPYDD